MGPPEGLSAGCASLQRATVCHGSRAGPRSKIRIHHDAGASRKAPRKRGDRYGLAESARALGRRPNCRVILEARRPQLAAGFPAAAIEPTAVGERSTPMSRATLDKTARRQLMDAALAPGFADPAAEQRRLIGEAGNRPTGRICGRRAIAVERFPGQVNFGIAVAAPGLTVMAVINILGDVSGAHLNPAVTIAFAARRTSRWARVPACIVARRANGSDLCPAKGG